MEREYTLNGNSWYSLIDVTECNVTNGLGYHDNPNPHIQSRFIHQSGENENVFTMVGHLRELDLNSRHYSTRMDYFVDAAADLSQKVEASPFSDHLIFEAGEAQVLIEKHKRKYFNPMVTAAQMVQDIKEAKRRSSRSWISRFFGKKDSSLAA